MAEEQCGIQFRLNAYVPTLGCLLTDYPRISQFRDSALRRTPPVNFALPLHRDAFPRGLLIEFPAGARSTPDAPLARLCMEADGNPDGAALTLQLWPTGEKHQIGRASPEQAVRDRWAKLVGAANASYSHPVTVEKNLLVVLVSHAVVRNELFQHRESILEKLKQLPGCSHIKGLALRAG